MAFGLFSARPLTDPSVRLPINFNTRRPLRDSHDRVARDMALESAQENSRWGIGKPVALKIGNMLNPNSDLDADLDFDDAFPVPLTNAELAGRGQRSSHIIQMGVAQPHRRGIFARAQFGRVQTAVAPTGHPNPLGPRQVAMRNMDSRLQRQRPWDLNYDN